MTRAALLLCIAILLSTALGGVARAQLSGARPSASPQAAADPHRQLDDILQQQMYRAWKLRQEGTLPSGVEPPKGLLDLLKRPFHALGDFVKWLFRSSPRLFNGNRGTSSFLPLFLKALAWGTVTIAVIAILIVLARVFSGAKRTENRALILSREQIQEAMESGNALALATSQWMDEAQRLAAEQNFRAAYRALYLALLSGLHTAGKIEHNRNRTNWTYVQHYRGPTEERATFSELTDLFDRVWYGRKLEQGRDLQQLRGAVAGLTAGRPA